LSEGEGHAKRSFLNKIPSFRILSEEEGKAKRIKRGLGRAFFIFQMAYSPSTSSVRTRGNPRISAQKTKRKTALARSKKTIISKS
jgi:hypothetical protein